MTAGAAMCAGSSSWRRFGWAVNALILRETRTRFGRSHLGYLRALLEPLAWIASLWGVFVLLDRASPIAAPLSFFLLTGVCPWVAFMRTWTYTSHALEANRGLLSFPGVKPLDLVVARALLEFVTQLFVLAILVIVLHWWFDDPALLPEDPFGVLLAFSTIVLLGVGFGLVSESITLAFNSFNVIAQAAGRFLFFLSGVFFVSDRLPVDYQQILSWNPLLHAIEWFRADYFSVIENGAFEVAYLLGVTLSLLLAGMVLQRVFVHAHLAG